MQIVEEKKERSKYEQGRLHIVTFGKLGEKLSTYAPDSDNYVHATEQGRDLVKSGEAASFAVLRVLGNSLEPGPWVKE